MTRDRLLGKVFAAPDGTPVRVVALDSVAGDRVRIEIAAARMWVPGSEFSRLINEGRLVESEKAA